MRFTSAVLTTSALVLASTALGTETIYPPGGVGFFKVSLAGESDFIGCINEDGKWTVTGTCAEVHGNGQGGVTGPLGWLIVNEESTITLTTTTWSTAWVGTHADQNRNTSKLIANYGAEESDAPHGGPVWYAAAIPSGDGAEEVSGVETEGAQEINLFFQSTFDRD